MRQRVWGLVEVLVELDGALGNVEGEVKFLRLVGLGGEDADLDAGLGLRHLALQFPKGEGHQVGRHPDRFLEVVDAIGHMVLGHIGDDGLAGMLIKLDGQGEGRLGSGLVDRREGLTRRSGFKLGADDLLLLTVDLIVGRVDPHHAVGQWGGVVETETDVTRARQGDLHRLVVVLDGVRQRLVIGRDVDEVQVLLVEPDDRLTGVTGDGRGPRDQLLAPVDVEVEVIVAWLERVQQSFVFCH